MQQGKPFRLGKKYPRWCMSGKTRPYFRGNAHRAGGVRSTTKNTRGGVCPAGRDCTFGGMPTGQAASEVQQKIPAVVYARQDATVLSGECPQGRRRPKYNKTCSISPLLFRRLGVPVNRGNRNTGTGYINT